MPRKKEKDRSKLFSRLVGARVTEKVYKRLENLRDHSNCATVGEVARKLISRKKIICYYRDGSLDDAVEELCIVQRELKTVGVNINQITRYFNSTTDARQKMLYAFKASDQNRRMDAKVDKLLDIVVKLSWKWLPNSPPKLGLGRMGRYPLEPEEIRDG
jgi:hypothetical protein